MAAYTYWLIRLVLTTTYVALGCDQDYIRCNDGLCIPKEYSNLCEASMKTTPDVITVMATSEKATADSLATEVMATPLSFMETKSVPSSVEVTDTSAAVTMAAVTTETGSVDTMGMGTVTTPASSLATRLTPIVSEMTTTAILIKSSKAPVNTCHLGYTMCNDGRCEPYPSLCGETGYIATKAPPTEPSPTMTVTGYFSGQTVSVATTEDTTASATLSGTTTTRPIVKDKNGEEVCPSGWEKCKDGVCEPFHWLCTEHDGTIVTTPAPFTKPTPIGTTTTMVETGPPSPVGQQNTVAPLLVSGATVSMVPSTGGACPHGWELCTDGLCEPFHWLCTEHDGTNVTFPTPGPIPTGSVTSGASPGVSSTAAEIATTTERPTSTTTVGSTVVVVTDSSGACPIGWEKCFHGACEPYHYLCDDHVVPVVG